MHLKGQLGHHWTFFVFFIRSKERSGQLAAPVKQKFNHEEENRGASGSDTLIYVVKKGDRTGRVLIILSQSIQYESICGDGVDLMPASKVVTDW